MNFFTGKWEGRETGLSGIGKEFRTYRFILDSNYICRNNKSVFDPQDANPEGAAHEDWGILGHDSFVNKFKMRYFHSEGYINSYMLENISDNSTKNEFNSYNLENVPEGWKARITLEKIDEDTIEETFDRAQTGKDHVTHLENT
jgi:hypothetical protein